MFYYIQCAQYKYGLLLGLLVSPQLHRLLCGVRLRPSRHRSPRFVNVHFQALDRPLRDEDSEMIEDERRRLGRFLLRSLETEREALELDSELSDELDPESDSESELSEEDDLEDLFYNGALANVDTRCEVLTTFWLSSEFSQVHLPLLLSLWIAQVPVVPAPLPLKFGWPFHSWAIALVKF